MGAITVPFHRVYVHPLRDPQVWPEAADEGAQRVTAKTGSYEH